MRFAEVLAEAGAAVALVARRSDRLAAVKARIERPAVAPSRSRPTCSIAPRWCAPSTAPRPSFGTVDILVNNAGVVHADRAVELAEAEWRRVLGTNLDAVLFWSQEAARRLIAAEQGRRDRQHRLDPGLRRRQGRGGLRGVEGRA